MMTEAVGDASKTKSWRGWVMFWAALIMAIFIGANVHFLMVALESQPECLAHHKAGDATPGQYAAANSSC